MNTLRAGLRGCDRATDVVGPGTLALLDRAAGAQAPAVKVTGGGSTTFGIDLDGDGEIDGSHFGMGVVIFSDGSAQGNFNCLMAGNVDILGLRLMSVEGKVTRGTINGRSFSGTGTVKVLNAFGPGVRSIFKDISFAVAITPGGPGIGTLQLTVFGVFDGGAGDTSPGNGNYDLAVETVTSGRIDLR